MGNMKLVNSQNERHNRLMRSVVTKLSGGGVTSINALTRFEKGALTELMGAFISHVHQLSVSAKLPRLFNYRGARYYFRCTSFGRAILLCPKTKQPLYSCAYGSI